MADVWCGQDDAFYALGLDCRITVWGQRLVWGSGLRAYVFGLSLKLLVPFGSAFYQHRCCDIAFNILTASKKNHWWFCSQSAPPLPIHHHRNKGKSKVCPRSTADDEGSSSPGSMAAFQAILRFLWGFPYWGRS